MSITFKILNDEEVENHDECLCTSYFSDDELNSPADPQCPYCEGSGELRYKSGKHDINVSNFNARTILQLVEPGKYDQGEEMTGAWTPEVFPKIRSNIMRTINSKRKLNSVSRELSQVGNFIDCGVSSERVKMRLEELLTIITKAGKMGTNIIFY